MESGVLDKGDRAGQGGLQDRCGKLNGLKSLIYLILKGLLHG